MGIDPKAIRERIGGKLVNGRWRPPLGTPVVGWFHLSLAIEPPSVTHHDKRLGWRRGKAGKPTPTLRDSPELVKVWELYDLAIKERPSPLVPLAGPIALHVLFAFPAEKDMPADVVATWRVVKPDLDNQAKTLKDMLTLRGYWEDDSLVAHERLSKLDTHYPRIEVYARTLWAPHLDGGDRHAERFRELGGVVHPLPWTDERDATRAKRLGLPPAASPETRFAARPAHESSDTQTTPQTRKERV